MRVRVSLDFDILIESFISLCIIETVGAIFPEYNNTMIKVVQNRSSFFGSIWHTRPLIIHNTVHWSVRHTQSFKCPLIYPIKWDNWLLCCLFLTKKGKQRFYKLLAFWRLVRPFTHFTKNAKYNNNLWEKCLSVHVAERKILHVRYLMYGWLFYKVHLPPPEKWQQNRTKIQKFHRSAASAKTIRSIAITFLVSTSNSK
jgi:hypothetical protein